MSDATPHSPGSWTPLDRRRGRWLGLFGLLTISIGVTWWFLFGARGLSERGRLSDPAGPIVGFVFSADGRALATTGYVGAPPTPGKPGRTTLKMWDAATLGPRAGWEPPAAAFGFWGWTLSADGRLLAGNLGSKVVVWTTGTGVRQAEFAIPVPALYRFHDLAFAPDGATLLLGVQHCINGDKLPVEVIVWETATWQERTRLQYPVPHVNRMVFSGDRRTLATGTETGEISLWDVASTQPTATLEGGPGGFVASIAFSADQTKLAVAYRAGGDPRSGTIYLWDLATHRPLAEWAATAHGLAFSPDGRFLAGAGLRRGDLVPDWQVAVRALQALGASARDNEIKLWDLAGKREWLVLSEPLEKSNRGLAATFTPDGKSLVTTCGDGSLRFWSVPGR